MSGQMTGADLEQLDELSTAYQQAGEQFTTKAAALRTGIAGAIQVFDGALRRLTTRTRALTDDIKSEIADVASMAAGVAWTGANRAGFDGDLGTFRQAVDHGAVALDEGIGELESQVTTRFTPVMDEFGTSLQEALDLANDDAVTMNEAVAAQRANLDEVANVGWTSA